VPVRSLQRLFAEYVGASPGVPHAKAREGLAPGAAARGGGAGGRGRGDRLAALAADLGYADQAHLTRDFTAAVGAPPGRYAGG